MNAQSTALARVGRLLENEGIDHWLFGGWAVDFYAGSVGRPHFDVDLAVWLDDVPHIIALPALVRSKSSTREDDPEDAAKDQADVARLTNL